ncbi:MAG: hypothetical protein J6Y23_12390 [Prevotella sp.]|nr:hypothetical protein [Prevotella sp.]
MEKMEKQKKKDYEVPALTVVSFKTERGYAFSMTFNALSHGSNATDNEYMEAERTDYGSATNYEWF